MKAAVIILTVTLLINLSGWVAMLYLLPIWRRRWESIGWLERDEQEKALERARHDKRTSQFVSKPPLPN